MNASDRFWLGLVASVAVYELFIGDDGDLLTDAARRYRQHHPLMARVLPVATTLHLVGWLPESVDIYEPGGNMKQAMRIGALIGGCAYLTRILLARDNTVGFGW